MIRRSPWVLTFIIGLYLLTKLMTLYESPCAVLGVKSPYDNKKLRSAYRHVAKCTHPDRFSNLTPAERRRASTLFMRVEQAKSDLEEDLRRQKTASCFGEGGPFAIEIGLCYLIFGQLFTARGLSELPQFGHFFLQFLYGLVTFEHGFMSTIGLMLFLYQIVNYGQLVFGPIPTLYCLFVSPFVRVWVALKKAAGKDTSEREDSIKSLPILSRNEVLELRSKVKTMQMSLKQLDEKFEKTQTISQTDKDENKKREAKRQLVTIRKQRVQVATRMKAQLDMYVFENIKDEHNDKDAEKARKRVERFAESSTTVSGSRRTRKKKRNNKNSTNAQKKEFEAGAITGQDQTTRIANALDESGLRRRIPAGRAHASDLIDNEDETKTRLVVRRRVGVEPLKSFFPTRSLYRTIARHEIRAPGQGGVLYAMAAIQFRFLLTMTKPVIPLLMLVITGTVWSGIMTSMVTGHVLRSYVPQMKHYMLHISLLILGFMHTLLGVRAFQVEQHAENASADSNLLLQWHWGFNDVIQVANIATIGALYTSISGLGNEPNMCASFAAGVALRMFVHDNAAVLTQNLLDSVTSSLPVQFVSLDAVLTRGGSGVGDCSGGPFRMFFDNTDMIVLMFRIFLLAIPFAAAVQWTRRLVRVFKTRGTRRFSSMRLLSCALMSCVMILQLFMILRLSIDGVNGSIVGFYMSLLMGCIWESLLSTYDIRGKFVSFLLLVVLIFC